MIFQLHIWWVQFSVRKFTVYLLTEAGND